MPRRKKPARDMTTEEAIRALFPKRVVDRVKDELATKRKKRSEKKDRRPKESGKK